MTNLEYLLSQMQNGVSATTPNIQPDSKLLYNQTNPDSKLLYNQTNQETTKPLYSLSDEKVKTLFDGNDKLNTLTIARDNKQLALRKDEIDYGDDNWLVESAKAFANELLPHAYQIPVNKDGKRYNTANKDFNDDDLSNIWNKYEDNPAGNKTLYYLRKLDPVTGQYMYKAGIAHTSAADRYLGQIKATGYEILGEKRFDEASAVEKQIHGNKEFLKSRVYDYGAVEEQGAEDYWGSGKSELYSKDILGLDTGTSADYAANKVASVRKMLGLIPNDKQREDTLEFIDAFQSGGINLAGGALKLIGEVINTSEGDGALEAIGKKLQKDANKIAGYNPRIAAEAAKGLEDSFNSGDALGYLQNMLKGSPQWLAQSLPNMAAFAATTAATTAITKNPLAGMTAGAALLGAIRANDTLDTREKSIGRKATTEEIASIYAVSTALSMFEYGALKFAMSGKSILATDKAGKTLDVTKQLVGNKNRLNETALILGKAISVGAQAALAEGSEEVLAGLTEFVMTNYGTEKYNGVSIADMLTSEEARSTAIRSFGAGAGAGGLASATFGTVNNLDLIGKAYRTKKVEEIKQKYTERDIIQKDLESRKLSITEDMNTDDAVIVEDLNTYIDSIKYLNPNSATYAEDVKTILSDVEEIKKQLSTYIKPETDNTQLNTETILDNTQQTQADTDQYSTTADTLDLTREDISDVEIQEAATDLVTKTIQAQEAGKTYELTTNEQAFQAAYGGAVNAKFTEAYKANDKESKVQVEEDAQLDEVQQDRLHKAGMDKITTLTDRASKVKVSPIEDTRVSETSKKKGKLFDPIGTTDEKINEVIAEGYDKDSKDNTFMKRIARKLGYGKQEHKLLQNLAKEIESKLDATQEAMSNILPDGEKATVANVLRAVAIGMSNIRGGQTAEYDISNKYGIEHKISGARKLQLVNQIGQAYTNAFGFKLTGTEDDVARAYAERGQHIIKLMQALDMVTETEESLPLHNIVESDPMNPVMLGIDKNKRTARMKVLTLTSNESTGRRKNKNRLADAVSTFSKLFTPPNVEILATEGQTAVVMSKGAKSVKISKKHQAIIKLYSALKYRIKPEALSILRELKTLYDKHGHDIDKLIAEEKDVVAALQLVDENSALTKMSEVGRKINRTENLVAVLESLDEIEAMMTEGDGFNYHYESAINERIHVLQTVLEFQGDKYMSRQMVTGGEYTTADKDAFNVLVANVAEEMGISKDEVKNPTGNLSKAIESIKGKNGTISLTDLVYLSGKFDVESPFKLLSLLRAVHDISKADGYKVTTSYMVESDATASGIINTLLNLSGFKSIQKILGKLGIGKYAVKGEVQDPYNVLSDIALANNTMRYTEKVKPIVDRLITVMSNGKEGGATKFLRELVKYAMMPWFYGQNSDNTGYSMGNSIAVDMVKSAIKGNAAALKWINEILDTEYTTDDSTTGISTYNEKYVNSAKRVADLVASGTYTLFDTETTSNDKATAQIIQASIIEYKNGKEISREKVWLPIDTAISIESIAIHNITDAKLKAETKGVTREQQLQKLSKLLKGKNIIAHNASYDKEVLNNNVGAKVIADSNMYDSLDVARVIAHTGSSSMEYTKGTSQEAMASKYGHKYEGAHDSMFDIELLSKMLPSMLSDMKNTLEKKSKNSSNIKDVSQKDIKTLSKFFWDTIGDHYVRTLEATFEDVKKYRKMMSDMYDLLDKSGKWEGTIKSAMGTELGTNEKMSIQKLKSMTLKDIDKELLLVNKMLNNRTSFSVNLQHATDAALLLLTLRDVMASKGNIDGIMTVHDALYSDANTAKSIMKAYNKYTVQLANDYDYLTAALNEVEEVYKDNTSKAVAKQIEALKEEITELKKNKVEFLSPVKTNILGQKDAIDIWGTESDTDTETTVQNTNTETKKSISRTITAIKDAVRKKDIAGIVEAISQLPIDTGHKDLLNKVMTAVQDGVQLVIGKEFSGGNNEVTIGKTTKMGANTLVETLAHEVDHAVQLQWMSKNLNSREMKYLEKVLNRLPSIRNKVSADVQARIDYILDPKRTYDKPTDKRLYQTAELVSVLSNEPKMSEAILGQFKASKKNIIEVIKDLINKAYKSFKDMGDINSLELDTDTIMSAIQSIDDNAKLNATVSIDKVSPANMIKEKDHNDSIIMAPYNAINDTISKSNSFMSDWMIIWGDTMIEHMGPPLRNAHVSMKRNSALYKSAVSILRNGFYDSDFAQRMHYLLGVAGDVKDKVVKEALRLSNEYQQESVKQLEEMAVLDRLLKDTYSVHDQKKLYKMFANTGIANIIMNEEVYKGILSGEIGYKEALNKVSKGMSEEVKNKLDMIATGSGFLGEHTDGDVNVFSAGVYTNEAQVYVTLKALEGISGSQALLTEMNVDTRNLMMSLALVNKKLNDELNGELNEKSKDYRGMRYSEDVGYHGLYDGSFSMDLHEKVYESKVVTLSQLRRSENSSENGWFVVQQPTNSTIGVISRVSYEAGYQTGTGLEKNRYVNGIMLSREQSKPIVDRLRTLGSYEDKVTWLNNNSLVQDGERFRVKVPYAVKVKELGLIENAAHSLYRTKMHNTDLIASESVRRILLEAGTRKINSENGMKELERILRNNDKEGLRGTRTEVEPFLTIDYTAPSLKHLQSFDDLKKEYPMIAKYFKTPEGLTSFNNFNKKVSLVKRGVAEVLLGYKKGQIFGNDNRDAAQWEQMFKKMIILAKQKMVVMNPIKLLHDTVTNVGILSMMDMTPTEIYRGMKEGYGAYREFSAARGKMVELKIAARLADAKWEMDKTTENETARKNAITIMDMHGKKMKGMDFYEAYNAGFVQSYSTDLVIKEMDTISGIQNDIDKMIDKYTHDKKGNPNKLFDAIKWFANTGPQIDEILLAAGNSAKLKGSDIGTELVAVAKRLKNKKNDKDSVSRYVSEFIGSPASEAAAYGSAYMVLGDIMAKYTLAKHLLGKENPRSGTRGNRRVYTSEEAYALANETFIDYRANLPKEIQVLSDYGILLFPPYWMRVQKVIAGLIKYHPVSALVSYGTEMAIGAESLSVLNQNIVTKAGGYYGIIHSPTDSISLHGIVFGFGAV